MKPDPVHTAGVVVAHWHGSWQYLLLRAYRNWDFPKGVVRPTEGLREAALRELGEETGIQAHGLHFPCGDAHADTVFYKSSHAGHPRWKQAHFFVAVSQNLEIKLSREHQEGRWLTFHDAQMLLVPRLRTVLLWAQKGLKDSAPEI